MPRLMFQHPCAQVIAGEWHAIPFRSRVHDLVSEILTNVGIFHRPKLQKPMPANIIEVVSIWKKHSEIFVQDIYKER
jgi:hypothetical protein